MLQKCNFMELKSLESFFKNYVKETQNNNNNNNNNNDNYHENSLLYYHFICID